MSKYKTLRFGWVNIKGRGQVFDPWLACLFIKLRDRDRQVMKDCLEGL